MLTELPQIYLDDSVVSLWPWRSATSCSPAFYAWALWQGQRSGDVGWGQVGLGGSGHHGADSASQVHGGVVGRVGEPVKLLRSIAGKASWLAGVLPRARWAVAVFYAVVYSNHDDVELRKEEDLRLSRGDHRKNWPGQHGGGDHHHGRFPGGPWSSTESPVELLALSWAPPHPKSSWMESLAVLVPSNLPLALKPLSLLGVAQERDDSGKASDRIFQARGIYFGFFFVFFGFFSLFASWLLGFLASWLLGFSASWLLGFSASRLLSSWLFGFLASRLLGFLAFRLLGFLASRLLGFWAFGFLLVYAAFGASAFPVPLRQVAFFRHHGGGCRPPQHPRYVLDFLQRFN